jgi:hypothetical protein
MTTSTYSQVDQLAAALTSFMKAKYKGTQDSEAASAEIGEFRAGEMQPKTRFIEVSDRWWTTPDSERSLFTLVGQIFAQKRAAPKTGWYVRRAGKSLWIYLGTYNEAMNRLAKLTREVSKAH